ncbi:MAG: hypothetical protein EHM16_09325 [Betaproteobacteria bacterium]|nr:MAG: hypothetical protein EHM16_09325 [Betaproteobacteria bacterium]
MQTGILAPTQPALSRQNTPPLGENHPFPHVHASRPSRLVKPHTPLNLVVAITAIFKPGDNDSVSSARSHDITVAQPRSLQSTAKHLEAEKRSEKTLNGILSRLVCSATQNGIAIELRDQTRIDWFRRNAILLKRARE